MLKSPTENAELQNRRSMAKAFRAFAAGANPLDYLLKIYEENFLLLGSLLGSIRQYSGAHLSHVPGRPPLWLEVIEQQPYTSIVRLTHSFNVVGQNHGLELDPNAYVRAYHDTRQAETTHCHFGAQVKGLFSLDVPLHEVNQKRVRMSIFFNKWLRYLIESGHSAASFAAVDALPQSPGAPIIHRENGVS